MDLERNPFFILGATTRDDRRRLADLAEEKSLLLDEADAREATATLTNPRKRLSAELAWLPGLGPKRIAEALSVLQSNPAALYDQDGLPALARANLLAAGLVKVVDGMDVDGVAEWIILLAKSNDELDVESIAMLLNEERSVAGFPVISELTRVESDLQSRRQDYRRAIKDALDRMPAPSLIQVVTRAVEKATDHGEVHAPILIDDLVDSYDVEAQGFLEKETENITTLIGQIRSAAETNDDNLRVIALVQKLERVVKNWDVVAQPIQLSARSRGLDHELSHQVAQQIRSLAIDLFNDHDLLDVSRQLTALQQEVFAEVGRVVEQTEEDASALEGIAKAQEMSGLLNPISDLCRIAIENTEKNPSTADREAQRMINKSASLISELVKNNVPLELQAKSKDEIALTIMHCAVVYGNETNKYKQCMSLLVEALRYASSSDTKWDSEESGGR